MNCFIDMTYHMTIHYKKKSFNRKSL